MKTARFILKLVALGLSVATAAYLIIAYWDKIVDFFYSISDKIEEKRATCLCKDEFEDYADCDV